MSCFDAFRGSRRGAQTAPGRIYNDFSTKGIASLLDPAIFDYESRTRRRLRPNSPAETLLSATPKRSRGNTKSKMDRRSAGESVTLWPICGTRKFRRGRSRPATESEPSLLTENKWLTVFVSGRVVVQRNESSGMVTWVGSLSIESGAAPNIYWPQQRPPCATRGPGRNGKPSNSPGPRADFEMSPYRISSTSE